MKDVVTALLASAFMAFWLMATVHAEDRGDAPATANEAAVRTFQIVYNEHPHYYEYGGLIVLRPDGKYDSTQPESDHHVDNMDIDDDPLLVAPNKIVADYHTHPCVEGYIPGVFSGMDLHSMRSSNHGGYILDECTGEVHYWEPGMPYDEPKDDEEKIGVIMGGRHALTAKGKIVGRIVVDGKKIIL